MSNNERGYLYVMPPIDAWDSLGWQEIPADWRGEAARQSVERAVTQFKRHGWWEEPISVGPLVMPLPSEDNAGSEALRWAVSVKISNNGTTFIWSPAALPWLDAYAG